MPKALTTLFLLFLSFVIGGIQPVQAQTSVRISGRIFDACDGHPVSLAEIRIRGSDFSATTDQFGSFELEHIPDGRYRLDIDASGYLPVTSDEIDVASDITRRITIRLERRIYDLGEREVRGRLAPLPVSGIEIIGRPEIERSDARSLAEVLNRVEGVYIQESGPVGGKSQVCIRGSATNQVLVLLDGRRMNSAGDGEADLSSIPLEMVEKVEVYRGGQSAQYGGDALGGVVNIITRISDPHNSPEIMARKYWGKWKTALYDMTLINPVRLKNLTTKFTYGFRGSNGDFDYNYTGAVYPRHEIERIYSGIRSNADFESRNYFVSGLYQPAVETRIGFSGQVYQSHQGLPGKVSQPDTISRKSDDRILASVDLKHDWSMKHSLDISFGFSRLTQEFDNQSGLSPYLSRYTNDIAESEIVSRFRPWIGNEMSSGAAIQRNILYHDELLQPQNSMGRTVRDNVGLFAADRQTCDLKRIPFWDMAALDVSIRWDNTDTKKDTDGDTDPVHHLSHWSQKIGGSISRGDSLRVIIRGSYGTSYRLPEVNALFWKNDIRSQGNPDLRPERSEHSDAGLEIAIDRGIQISAGITYYHSRVNDLIVWRPTSPLGVWKPENLEAALITGHEDFIRIGVAGDRLRLTYSNTITNARNKTAASISYNKMLTFRPHYVTGLECEARIWKLRGAYRIRMVDIRYLVEANTKWYGAYRVDNADLGFVTEYSHFEIEAAYQVNNLRGESYELMTHYPMPGREWGVSLSLVYRIE